MKKIFALILTVLMLASILCACSAKSGSAAPESNGAMMDAEYAGEPGEIPQKDLTSASGSSSQVVAPNQKLVRKVWLEAETEDLDALVEQVDQKIAALGGYAESRQVYHGNSNTYRRRTASLTVRIPVSQLDQFVTHVKGLTNVISSNETADDITLSYIATESRLNALQTEHDRLLELLAKAETMRDLLEIESRLTDVRAELEKVGSQLKLYDNMVDYSTIYLTVNEVKEYTDVTEPETVWQRIGKGLDESFNNIGTFFEELFVFIIVALPYLAIPGIIAIVVLLIIKGSRKNKKAKEKENKE